MAYEKLGLADGQVLRAEHLDHIERGIEENSTALEDKIGNKDFDASVEAALKKAKESGQFDGADGETPIFTIKKENGVTTITMTIKDETQTITINDGADGTATDEQVNIYVSKWLEEHPEVTVENGSITYDKLADEVKDDISNLQEQVADCYNKTQINEMLGSYINEVAELIGGEA